jgi:hypothetical protein
LDSQAGAGNPDLQLLRKSMPTEPLTDQQNERKLAVFSILVSLFERAYILVYEEKMDRQTQRLWLSWEDYMREWCRRKDFRDALPDLLKGEDEDFRARIQTIAEIEKVGSPQRSWQRLLNSKRKQEHEGGGKRRCRKIFRL